VRVDIASFHNVSLNRNALLAESTLISTIYLSLKYSNQVNTLV